MDRWENSNLRYHASEKYLILLKMHHTAHESGLRIPLKIFPLEKAGISPIQAKKFIGKVSKNVDNLLK
jgi:hypothetical protein